MKDKLLLEQSSQGQKPLALPIVQERTLISPNFTANNLMGQKETFKHMENGSIYRDQDGKTKEELQTFLNNGSVGIDLGFDEACIVLAIANIFTRCDYPDFVEFPKKELYEALRFGNKLSGWQRQKIAKTLVDLSEKKFPIYWKEDNVKWLTFDTLIKIAWGIRNEDGNFEFDVIPPKKNCTLYRIALNKFLFGGLTNHNFRLAEPNIGRDIRDYRRRRGEKPSKYDIRLYYLLLGENKRVIRRNYLKIAAAPMLMGNYIKQRKYKIIRKKLNSIYEMYNNLGYLSNCEFDADGSRYDVDILVLNPNKFYRLRDNHHER